MTYHAMMFFWSLSEKHWLLLPFEWIGNFLEDWGLQTGRITLRDDVLAEIEAAQAEFDYET